MLLLNDKLIDIPIMSLQTGAELARTQAPIIDPRNLKIVAFFVDGPHLDQRPSVLHISDIRENGELGFIVDDTSALMSLDGLVRLNEILEFEFELIGCKVYDTLHKHLGHVEYYAFEPNGFVVEQLHLKQSFLKNLSHASRIIGRNQIVSVTKGIIVVDAPTISAKEAATATPVFANPFRPTPQVEPIIPRRSTPV